MRVGSTSTVYSIRALGLTMAVTMVTFPAKLPGTTRFRGMAMTRTRAQTSRTNSEHTYSLTFAAVVVMIGIMINGYSVYSVPMPLSTPRGSKSMASGSHSGTDTDLGISSESGDASASLPVKYTAASIEVCFLDVCCYCIFFSKSLKTIYLHIYLLL